MFAAPPPDPGVEILLATQGMSKGLRQTDGPQLVARGTLDWGALTLGVQYRNISSPSAEGELWAFASLRAEAAGFQLSGGITAKRWIATSGRPDRGSVELNGAIARGFGPVAARLSLIYSPDELGTGGSSLYAEAGATLRVTAATSLAVGASRRERAGASDYTAFNAGLVHRLSPHVTAELRYYDTDRGGLGAIYGARAVAALRFRF
jgi:hypothetical protein